LYLICAYLSTTPSLCLGLEWVVTTGASSLSAVNAIKASITNTHLVLVSIPKRIIKSSSNTYKVHVSTLTRDSAARKSTDSNLAERSAKTVSRAIAWASGALARCASESRVAHALASLPVALALTGALHIEVGFVLLGSEEALLCVCGVHFVFRDVGLCAL
jgi:hypothetical protein